jgi:hypothetical protein
VQSKIVEAYNIIAHLNTIRLNLITYIKISLWWYGIGGIRKEENHFIGNELTNRRYYQRYKR